MTCVLENKSNLLDEKAKKTVRKALKALGKKILHLLCTAEVFRLRQTRILVSAQLTATAEKSLLNMRQVFLMLYSLDRLGKQNPVILLSTQAHFFPATPYLLI